MAKVCVCINALWELKSVQYLNQIHLKIFAKSDIKNLIGIGSMIIKRIITLWRLNNHK